MKAFLLVLFLSSVFSNLSAQETEKELLAREYMDQGEFDKAVVLYSEIYKKNKNTYIYDNYLSCLIEIKDWKEAEKIIAKQVKNKPAIPRFQVDQAYVYLLQEKQKDAKKTFDKAVNWAKVQENLIIDLAAAFEVRELNEWTLQSLLIGKKEHPGSVAIINALAELHRRNARYEAMFDEYFSLLDNPMYGVIDLEKILQDVIMEDIEGGAAEVFRVMLLKKLQKEPSNYDFTKLLIWYYIQMFEFDKAVLQAQAFERRSKGDGELLYEVAELCISNKAWASAEQALQHIIDKGSDEPYFYEARQKMLEVKYEKLTNNFESTKESLEALAIEFRLALEETFYRSSRFELIILLARLEAFYLDEPINAVERLEKLLNTRGYEQLEYARAKLLLGDVMIVKGEVWEASLLYSQVEKSLKHDTIGFYAKFKNARLYYYLGEIDYASALLDILRGATSKLIANDAMKLSLLIQDNIDHDSSYVPLTYYARADMLDFSMKYEEAILTLDTILMTHPGHPIIDEALFKKANILIRLKRFDAAVLVLREILAAHYDDILGDNAVFLLAKINEEYLGNSEKAQEYYLQLILDFPGSVYASEARKRYRLLRGDNID